MRHISIAIFVSLVAAGCSNSATQPPEGLAPGPTVRLRIENADSRGASLAASGHRVVVVWAATTEGETNIHSAVSEDDGRTFSSPVRVNNIEGDARVNGEQAPRVAVGRDIVVAWQSRQSGTSQIRVARSTDGGHSFGRAETIHDSSLTGARGWSSLVLDQDGAAHVAWLDGRNARKPAAASAARGAGHSAGGGHAHAEPTRQDIFHMTLSADGSRQESPVAANVCFCCKTSVATGSAQTGAQRDGGPRGVVYVAWRHIYPVNLRDMAVAASTDGGRTFSQPVRVSEDGWQLEGCPEDGPSIAVGPDGTLHIAWPTIPEKGASRKGVFYSYSTDGGRTFASRARVDEGDDVTNAAHPQIAVVDGRVAVVWDESTAAGPRIRLRFIGSTGDLANGAGAWRPEFLPALTFSEPGPISYPAIAASASGLVGAWTMNLANGSEIHVRRLNTAAGR
jgi:hypothetical protein